MLKCYGRKTLLDRYVKADRIWSNIWEVPFYFLHGAWTCCLKYLFKIFIYYILYIYIYIYISNFIFLKNFPCVQKFSVLHVFVDFLFFLIKFCPSGTSIAEHFYLKKVLPGKVALDFLQFLMCFFQFRFSSSRTLWFYWVYGKRNILAIFWNLRRVCLKQSID